MLALGPACGTASALCTRAYTLAGAGYVLSNPSSWNLAVLAAGLSLQVARIFNEERFLSGYPEYAEYRLRTRWRLLPFVF